MPLNSLGRKVLFGPKGEEKSRHRCEGNEGRAGGKTKKF